MRVGSDYQNGNFGEAFGVMIDELKLLARAVFVLDKDGKVVYSEIVPEVNPRTKLRCGSRGPQEGQLTFGPSFFVRSDKIE